MRLKGAYMAEPKQKMSRSRTRTRRGKQSFQKPQLVTCPKCKDKILPHHVCPVCGTYKGREVLDVKSKVMTKIKDKKAKSKNAE